MATPIDRHELTRAWRALHEIEHGDEGWQAIQICSALRIPVYAAFLFPGQFEALQIALPTSRSVEAARLPKATGFTVSLLRTSDSGASFIRLALVRTSEGQKDLFERMALDVLDCLAELDSDSSHDNLNTFIARVHAWKQFMGDRATQTLNHEEEAGLFGELALLSDLLAVTVPATAINAWGGPLGAVHDFSFDAGAIEVKASCSPGPFTVHIGSLEQLDIHGHRSLTLNVIRLSIQDDGISLSELIDRVSQQLSRFPRERQQLRTLLLHAGYAEFHAPHYVRRFMQVSTRFYPVADAFPRLTHAGVPTAIRTVRYEIDIDAVPVSAEDLVTTLKRLEVIRDT